MSALERITATLVAHGSGQHSRGCWQCPAHDDGKASLSVGPGDRGVVVKCQAGCRTEDVVAALGLTMADLFDESVRTVRRREVEAYTYVDENDRPLFEVVRFEPKGFKQRTAQGWGLHGARRVLYRLPQVMEEARKGGTVYVAEGERDVHALERAGAVATTNPMGAGNWRTEYAEALRGAEVVVVADRDEAGRKHARTIAGSLDGIAASVRIVEAADGKDAADHLRRHGLQDFRAYPHHAGAINGQPSTNGAGQAVSTVQAALEHSRVDLIALRRNGIPPREWVPGADGMLAKGKRHHIAAERKTGKSLGIGVVAAIDIVLAGGVVVVLDRENGADEYARRLDSVLSARGANAEVEECIRRGFRYHAWPQFKLEWGRSAAYAQAFDGASVAIFDSSRTFLTSVGLKEDQSDDYSAFTNALIDPLARAGISTVILDNVGHDDKSRARGSSAKGDLADVTFTMKALAPFSETRAGTLQIAVRESRFGDLHGTWTLPLGDRTYGSWSRPDAAPPPARKDLLAATVAVLAESSGGALGVNKIERAIRARPNPPRFSNDALREALAAWGTEPASGIVPGPNGKGYETDGSHGHSGHAADARHDPHAADDPAWAGMGTPGMAGNPEFIGHQAMPSDARHGPARQPCRGTPPRRGGTGGMGADMAAAWTDDELQALIDSEQGMQE